MRTLADELRHCLAGAGVQAQFARQPGVESLAAQLEVVAQRELQL